MTDDLVPFLRTANMATREQLERLCAKSAVRIEALTAQIAEDADVRTQIDHRIEELVAQVDALTAERDEWKKRHFQMRDERDAKAIAAKNYADFNHAWRKRAEALTADNARLKDEIAHLKSEDGYVQAFIEGQKAMPQGTFTVVDSPELATLRADNARLRGHLAYYREQFCEGFCEDFPAGFTNAECENDCGGCRARAALTGKADT
jgi:cell division protein FtsB